MESDNTFEFVKKQLYDYVREKARSFLDKNGIGSLFPYIDDEVNAKESAGKLNFTSKIDMLLNKTVDAVVKSRNENWNKIREEFNAHYLS